MPQISATVSKPLIEKINKQAKVEDVSFSAMVEVLLREAIAERESNAFFLKRLKKDKNNG